MSSLSNTIRIDVDVTNPGQFFACCGLLELASRLEPDFLAHFGNDEFILSGGLPLSELVDQIVTAQLLQLDPEDVTASPIQISAPFGIRLDWWKTRDKSSSDLKVWAGTMESFRIARAMQHAMRAPAFRTSKMLDVGMVTIDPDEPEKKVEPFYFDARRGPNAHSRDVGFSPNDLGLRTIASPAVELLCLIGLQRTRPVPSGAPRVFDYHTWSGPLPIALVPVAASGILPDSRPRAYRFESWFRTGQRKHKAFITAKPLT